MLVARNQAPDPPSTVRDHSGLRRVQDNGGRAACAAGDLIADKYRLRSVLAEGGMGTIWKAESETTGGLVAVKVPTHECAADAAERGDHLLFEAMAAASLHHLATVQVLDFGITEEGLPFIVMELLEGESLRDTIGRSGGLEAADAVRLLLPILGALRCAHARGIVHCDVKPENILLAHMGAATPEPKLIDFGIAIVGRGRSPSVGSDCVLGSPAYMSPEHMRGQPLDVRTDLWSFAVVLYEAIAGARPWNPGSGLALRRAILQDAPSSLAGKRGVDARLWQLLQRGLEKDRHQRWPTSAALEEALAGWLQGQGEEERAAEKSASAPPAVDTSSASTRPCTAAPTLRSPCRVDEQSSRAATEAVSSKRRREPGGGHPSSRAFWLAMAVALLVATRAASGGSSQATPPITCAIADASMDRQAVR